MSTLRARVLSELEAKGLRVLWGDLRSSPFVVLHKKEGMTVRSDFQHKMTVERVLLSLGIPNVRKVYFPHRLDMATQGILVASFDSTTCNELAKGLREGAWEKKYRAIVTVPQRVIDHSQNPVVRAKSSVYPLPMRTHPHIYGSMITPYGALASHGTLRSFIEKAAPILIRVNPQESSNHPTLESQSQHRLTRNHATTEELNLSHPLLYSMPRPIPSILKDVVKETMFYRSVPKEEAHIHNAKLAITEFKMMKFVPHKALALYEIKILTGRTHQIRVHLSESGLTIFGDSFYGKRESTGKDAPYAMHLQACLLRFPNPLKFGDWVSVELPMPRSWQLLLE